MGFLRYHTSESWCQQLTRGRCVTGMGYPRGVVYLAQYNGCLQVGRSPGNLGDRYNICTSQCESGAHGIAEAFLEAKVLYPGKVLEERNAPTVPVRISMCENDF